MLNGALNLSGNDAAGPLSGSGALGLAGTLTDTENGVSPSTFSGPLSGSGLLSKSGTGTLILTNSGNTFSGTVRIGAGRCN